MATKCKGRCFSNIFYLLVGAIAAFLIIAARQPDDFRYSRSATINAPAEVVFPLVNNLKKFNEWNPWAKLDPNAKNSFEGEEEGVGAKMSWEGNFEVGKGSMTTTEARPDEFIQFKMDFEKPMKATDTAEFTFKQEDDKTLVTWSIYGKRNFMAKAMGLVFNCEKMVGKQFDTGLANLKAMAENK